MFIPRLIDGVEPRCRECYDALIARWRHQAERAYTMAKRLQSTYGITLEDYGRMFVEQGGTCSICRSPQGDRPLVVDHDHATGAVRALLCSNCNAGIGMLKESPEVLARAIEYVDRHRAVPIPEMPSRPPANPPPPLKVPTRSAP